MKPPTRRRTYNTRHLGIALTSWMRAVVARHFPSIGVIRAKRRKEIYVRNSQRLCLVCKSKREAFDSLILFVVNNRRWANHKHGVSLSSAQNRSDIRTRFHGIDASFSILNGRIIDTTREDYATIAGIGQPQSAFALPAQQNIFARVSPNTKVVISNRYITRIGHSTQTPGPPKSRLVTVPLTNESPIKQILISLLDFRFPKRMQVNRRGIP